jgi:hypothetical protein
LSHGRARANETYDASRIIKGKFAGGVQQKSSAAGIDRAVARMERVKPGSAKRGTVRVPKDHLAAATKRARGRTRVAGMEFTSAKAEKVVDRGLKDVAKKGTRASSRGRALSKGGATAAVLNAGLGAIGDAGDLRAGRLSGRDFAKNRALDAAEGATSATVGALAAGATGTLVTGALGTSAGATAAGTVGAVGTSALGTIGGMGSAGGAVATAFGGITVASAAPVVIGGAVSISAGVLISKGFKRVRRKVKNNQRQLRTNAGSTLEPQVTGVDESGKALPEAVVVELKGRHTFKADELNEIKELLVRLETANGDAPAIRAKLRRRGFYLSDWHQPGQRFSTAELDRLVEGGLITVGPSPGVPD